MHQHFRIIGSARYLPATRIAAENLDERLGLSRGTTFARTGVQFRHRALPPESAATMAREVIRAALKSARVGLGEIDTLLDASLCQQQPVPCNAALVQEALGLEASGLTCMDVHASCLGFVAALKVVNGLFASDAARRVVVVCAETPLSGVNWQEPESACLMGDGAAAFVFEKTVPEHSCVLNFETHAEGAHLCEVRGGGHRLPAFDYKPERRSDYLFTMEGKALHKLASRLLPPLVERTLTEARSNFAELEVVPHQASGPSLELLARRLQIPRSRFHVTIAEHGNLVAASIPFVLHSVRQARPSGTRVMLLGTAAGYSQAAAVFSL
ncbi:MAG TPA: 3-oxoacyl-[acyl-carrier-protein] synthase III C-terminal domain-containing protein [Opitutaceae bacterium]|nr:3-oxoacyl-[acyl-carrier-protein] synthase III C-terminal domain-containing protein [Opitutaceae bacterium]